jgi:cell wall-associated NlpC family hydrolase
MGRWIRARLAAIVAISACLIIPNIVRAELRLASYHMNDLAAPVSSIQDMTGVDGSDVVMAALQLTGIPYRWGGNTPRSGLDCSGFVRYVFQNMVGMTLPRRAIQMSRVGQPVRRHNLQPGDLVFFDTHHSPRRAKPIVSHVGIYIGKNRFVHSPSTGKTIRIDRLFNRYWRVRYTGARRVAALAPSTAHYASISP